MMFYDIYSSKEWGSQFIVPDFVLPSKPQKILIMKPRNSSQGNCKYFNKKICNTDIYKDTFTPTTNTAISINYT